MSIKIAIHSGSNPYQQRWANRCKELGIYFEYVNGFDDNILKILDNFDGFLWRWAFHEPHAVKHARLILASAEKRGLKVFPNITTCWHYDNKIAQQYLLEITDTPVIKTHVFFDEQEALNWIEEAIYPLVFKLKSGASSENVKMVKNKFEAAKLCAQAFGEGFSAQGKISTGLKSKLISLRNEKSILEIARKISGSMKKYRERKLLQPLEKNYLYFQQFLPGNEYDTRVNIIGERAFAIRRMNRKNDFRASGSGIILYGADNIDLECVKTAFRVSQQNDFQCMAYDFLYDENGLPCISEISYTFLNKAINRCPGYWDHDLCWHEGDFNAADLIIDDLVTEIYAHKGGSPS